MQLGPGILNTRNRWLPGAMIATAEAAVDVRDYAGRIVGSGDTHDRRRRR